MTGSLGTTGQEAPRPTQKGQRAKSSIPGHPGGLLEGPRLQGVLRSSE